MRRTARTLVSLVAVMAVAAAANAELIEKDFHESFEVTEGVSLRLEYGDGDVTITPWEKDVIDVVVRYRADVKVVGFGTHAGFDVEFRQTDDRVTVRGIEGGSSGIYILHYVDEYDYTYEIKAPTYTVLDLRGDDGDLELAGWRADIECRTDDGDVKLTDVDNVNTEIWIEDGDVKLTGLTCDVVVKSDDGDITLVKSEVPHALFSMEDGDLRVVDCAGSFDASLDDGDVRMDGVTVSVLDIRGQDGDVDLDISSDGDIHVNVSTDDGDVGIRLAGGLSFAYLVTVDDGYVNIAVDGATDTESSEHRVSGRVGEGGGLVRVSTNDGDVELSTVE